MDSFVSNASRRCAASETGKEMIKHLMSVSKPTVAIAKFRAANSLEIPAADATYALLDSLGYERRYIHEATLAATINAAQRLVQSEELSKDQYLIFLDHIRYYIDIPCLQQLALQFLATKPSLIPEDICQRISASSHLYDYCDINIKHILWNQNANLFRQHILPLIHNYRYDRDLLYMSREAIGDSAKDFTVRRRKNKALLELSAAIGANLRLYMQALGIIRDLFLESNDPALGTLRLDLVMVMHDNDIGKLVSDDICYGLAWPLDACIIKQQMDEHRVQELQSFFDKFDNESMPYGEISLILSSPYARHVLSQYVLSILEEIAPASAVSQRYKELKFPRALLTMGHSAQDLIQQGHPKLPKDSQIKTRTFFQSLLEHIEDSSKLPTEEDISILSTSGVARQVLYTFVLKHAIDQHSNAISVWLPVICDIVPATLGIADANIDNELGPPAISTPHSIDGFELDAFIQSLVSCICTSSQTIVATLNSILQAQTSLGSVEAIQLPLLQLLIRVGRFRHHGHEQIIAFLVGCSKLLAFEYGTGANGFSKEATALFIFQLCEYAAAHCVVDPDCVGTLKEQYNALASVSPQQTFMYQIARCNCPNASKFLTV